MPTSIIACRGQAGSGLPPEEGTSGGRSSKSTRAIHSVEQAEDSPLSPHLGLRDARYNRGFSPHVLPKLPREMQGIFVSHACSDFADRKRGFAEQLSSLSQAKPIRVLHRRHSEVRPEHHTELRNRKSRAPSQSTELELLSVVRLDVTTRFDDTRRRPRPVGARGSCDLADPDSNETLDDLLIGNHMFLHLVVEGV